MADKVQQHIIPKTFLRRFEIPNYKDPNHVWCLNFEDIYTKEPQAKGINANIFKIKHFYTLPEFEDKLYLENFFAEKVEPEYEKIYNEIIKESGISELMRLRIIEWIFYTNQRTDFLREQIKRVYVEFSELMSRFDKNKQGLVFSKDSFDKEIQPLSNEASKHIHLDLILDDESYSKLIKLYCRNLITKSWIILKSNPDNPFIANDNPGFSINATKFYYQEPFNSTIHLNHPAFNYLVFSPKYCLYMEPFRTDTPIEINALNMKIEFKEITNELIDYVNFGTFFTAKKYLISNRYDSLVKWIDKNV